MGFTVTLTSSPNPSTYGQAVSFTAVLNQTSSGLMTFYSGAQQFGSVLVTPPSTTVVFSTPLLQPGTNSVTAKFQAFGDVNIYTSNTVSQAVSNTITDLSAATIEAILPPTAAAIGTAVSTDLFVGTQVSGSSVPVALPTATITSLTPPTAAAIASAIVADPPAVTISGSVAVTQSTSPWVVSNSGTFAVQDNGTATQSTATNTSTIASSFSSTLTTNGSQQMVQEQKSGFLYDLMLRILLELKGIRLATVATACDGNRNNDEDFDPVNFKQLGDEFYN